MKKQILVVDDEKLICDMLENVRSATGYQIETSTDPAVALEMCGAREYDLVISDVIMPSMTGLELMNSVLALEKQQHPVFIFMTGSAPEDVLSELKATNVYEVISKPFKISLVVDTVTRALKSRGVSHA